MSRERIRSFAGAVAIVTGGASGIGRALGRELVGRGATVMLADRDLEPAEVAAASIRKAGGSATAAALDVRDFAAFDKLVGATVERHGRLDYLFNNAGIAVGGEVRDYRLEHWHRVLDVNLRGVVNGVQAAYPVMLRQGFGHLVNTASLAGLMPTPGGASYAAAKHAVVGLSRSLRIEAAPRGVRVSVLCPGVIRTAILTDGGRHGEMLQPVAEETQRRIWRRLRPLEPERFARQALGAVARNRAIIIVPAWWRALWWIHRLSPALGDRLAAYIFHRVLAELWPDAERGR